MAIDPGQLARVMRKHAPRSYIRIFRAAHVATPLGTGPGPSRFCPPGASFQVLYMARDLKTALAETLLRDRFVAVPRREIHLREIALWAAVEVHATTPVRVADLRKAGPFRLGVDTDARGAQNHAAGQALGADLHASGLCDGLVYPSRFTGEDCYAIFDHAVTPALSAGVPMDLARVPGLVAALNRLDVRLVR